MSKRSELSPKHEAYIDGIMTGLSKNAAAIAAGMSSSSYMDSVPRIQAEIANARKEIEDATLLRRVDVINGILDAIHMAKIMSDPASAIRGWMEIGKILGHYAPEVKEIRLTGSQDRIKAQLENLSDEELMGIIEKEVKGEIVDEVVVDGR